MRALVLLTGIIFLNGCAYTPQVASLNPVVPNIKSNVGLGKTVYLHVVDERNESNLGSRTGDNFPGAKISSVQNVSELMYEKISDGLKAYGFIVKRFKGKTDRSFRAEIRQIKYEISVGLVTITVHANSAIKGICKSGDWQYEKMYRGGVKEEFLAIPFADTNERMINESLSKALEQMFLDNELQECLSS